MAGKDYGEDTYASRRTETVLGDIPSRDAEEILAGFPDDGTMVEITRTQITRLPDMHAKKQLTRRLALVGFTKELMSEYRLTGEAVWIERMPDGAVVAHRLKRIE